MEILSTVRAVRPLNLMEMVLLHTQDNVSYIDVDADDVSTYDLIFYKYRIIKSETLSTDDFVRAIIEHRAGVTGGEVNLLSGTPFTYIEVAAWMGGTQEHALRFMALGAAVGVFRILTPFELTEDAAYAMLLARCGYFGIVAVQSV